MQKHTVEFNQLAMANSEGSEAMLNRVMTKDNIGVAVLLEVRKEMMEMSCELSGFFFLILAFHILDMLSLLILMFLLCILFKWFGLWSYTLYIYVIYSKNMW